MNNNVPLMDWIIIGSLLLVMLVVMYAGDRTSKKWDEEYK